MQSGRRMVLLRRAAVADAPELYRIRYEAYLPQYGAYSSPDCPCVQSEADFLAQIRAGEVYAVTLGERIVGGLRLAAGEDCAEELPEAVRAVIRREHLYQT